ncbi:MAG: hypothetical protein M3M85_01745, partial [bacterium]|nr:hypothetical protein [bacterium]
RKILNRIRPDDKPEDVPAETGTVAPTETTEGQVVPPVTATEDPYSSGFSPDPVTPTVPPTEKTLEEILAEPEGTPITSTPPSAATIVPEQTPVETATAAPVPALAHTPPVPAEAAAETPAAASPESRDAILKKIADLKAKMAADVKEFPDEEGTIRHVLGNDIKVEEDKLNALPSDTAATTESGATGADTPAPEPVTTTIPDATIPEQVPVTPATNLATEGIRFEDGSGKGAIQGIEELKEQLKEQYEDDFSKAPAGVQKFMAETDATQQARNLGMYVGNKSAVIPEGSVLKFDEQGNLVFGKPDKMEILEKWRGEMRDYDQSDPVKMPKEVETPETSSDTAAEPETPATQVAESAQPKPPTTSPVEPVATPDKNVTTPNEEAWRSKSWSRSAEETSGFRPTKDFSPEELSAHDEAVEQARAAVDKNWPPQENSVPENKDYVARVRGYQAPEPEPYRYPEQGARVKGYGFGNRGLGNVGEYNQGRGNVIGYDPERGIYVRFYEDLSPHENNIVNSHQEFATDPDQLRLSGQDIMRAYKASREDLSVLFGNEHSLAWNHFDDMKASELIKATDAGINTNEGKMSKYLQLLKDFSDTKPKGGILGTKMGAESAKQYIARATMRLVKEGKLEEFQQAFETTFRK